MYDVRVTARRYDEAVSSLVIYQLGDCFAPLAMTKKMKKPFKETKVGKFLRGIVREIPFIGGIKDHVNSTDPADGGEKGKVDKTELTGQIVGALVVILPILNTLGLLPGWVIDIIQQILENIQF
jgi:hypothetical protein